MAETKQDLIDQVDELEQTLKQCEANLTDEVAGLHGRLEHSQRQTANVSRVFVTLYEEKRTLDLRMGWLEEAARDVVTSCEKHQPDLIVKLAEELGIETED